MKKPPDILKKGHTHADGRKQDEEREELEIEVVLWEDMSASEKADVIWGDNDQS